jgi:Tol biopolymer transport system component
MDPGDPSAGVSTPERFRDRALVDGLNQLRAQAGGERKDPPLTFPGGPADASAWTRPSGVELPPPPPPHVGPTPSDWLQRSLWAAAVLAAWGASAIVAYHRLGYYPPAGAGIFLAVGFVAVLGLGALLGGLANHKLRQRLGVALVAGALVVPIAAVSVVPGIKQLDTSLLPGSPDLVVTAAPDGRTSLYLIRRGGERIVRLTEARTVGPGAELSPDGRHIVFSDSRAGTFDLRVMELDPDGEPSGLRRITNDIENEEDPSWSPDGTQIVYQRGGEGTSDIAIVPAAGGQPIHLTDDGQSWNPGWSPDGSLIVFSAPSPEDEDNFDLWVMRPDGSHRRPLLDSGGNDYLPVWSPDGSRIQFTSDVAGNRDVWVADADGSGLRPLTPGSVDRDESWGWSPDARFVFFISDRSHTGGTFMYFVPVQGGDVRLSLIL